MEVDSENTTSDRKGASNIVLDGTSEFCRTLGDIPTYGQAGNRADEDDDLLVSVLNDRVTRCTGAPIILHNFAGFRAGAAGRETSHRSERTRPVSTWLAAGGWNSR